MIELTPTDIISNGWILVSPLTGKEYSLDLALNNTCVMVENTNGAIVAHDIPQDELIKITDGTITLSNVQFKLYHTADLSKYVE